MQIASLLNDDGPGTRDYAVALGRMHEIMRTASGIATNVYAFALDGFSAQMSEDEALALSQDPRVRFVEEDVVMEALVTQSNPPWGLDRIGQRDLPLNGAYGYTTTGAGVSAYIIRASPATVRNAIVNAATLNRLSGIPSGTASRLLFWWSSQ